uniref:acetylglutamate kinase n=1 Tax=Synstelium polycarpum TaxID=361085 RepID=A0A1L2FUZ8_9MYCE|nr:arginine [Synstelium polycarpum]
MLKRKYVHNQSLKRLQHHRLALHLERGKSIVLVKIGGGVIEHDISALISSLNFLRKIGLYPIVVHGGGPQLNAELAAAKEPAEYVEGLRVTPPSVLAIAQRVFARENLKIVEALEASGTRARPITQGVFQATPLDPAVYGFVGNVTKILTDAIASCISGDYVPVVSSLAMTPEGQVLNINADVAALELARAISPLKIVFINTTAGMKDGEGRVMRHIVLDQQYDELMKQPWVKHGTKLKLKEFKNCLDHLPRSTSITITSPALLQTELFAKNGSGTTVERGNAILTNDSVCFDRLSSLLPAGSANATQIRSQVDRDKLKVFANADYSAAVIVRALPASPSVHYVERFLVSSASISDESADAVFAAAATHCPGLIWRAESTDDAATVSWYRKIASGFNREGSAQEVFWTGISLADVARPLQQALNMGTSTFGETPASAASEALVANKATKKRIGLLGARGFTGGHLVGLIEQHPSLELALAASSTNYGKPVTTEFPNLRNKSMLFAEIKPDNIAEQTMQQGIDGWFMALPDLISKPYVDAIDRAPRQPHLVDLSADHRFDSSWIYGSPETNRARISGALRIANPGCYATGMYLSLTPFVKAGLLAGPPSCFGISGYSGAGSKPSEKNDMNNLRDNILPYKLVQHTHEKEVSHQLGSPIYFMPHVGQFFQGITLTISMRLNRAITKEEVISMYERHYANEPLIKIVKDAIPEVRANANKHTVSIGGITVHDNHVVVIATLDNLLKGAATQALQNMNLCLGLNELDGINL